MKMALLIIDLQKAYYNDKTKESMASACEYINAIIPFFRKKNLPIVWVQQKDEEDGAIPGQPGFEFIDQLKPEQQDYRITKEYGNGFNKTNCFDIIKKNGIDTIVITGFCAEYCVLSTYRGAQDLDLSPVILKNAISSDNKEHIKMVEEISNVISYGILSKVIDAI